MNYTDIAVPHPIEAIARTMAENAPGAYKGQWERMSPMLRNRWRNRATEAAEAYERALDQ